MSMSLHAVVKGRDEANCQWKQLADLKSISATGASFNLERHCEPGTLISLMVPLSAHLRCYDFNRKFYPVWGLVQHCEPMEVEDALSFHIGVAFIGKTCPRSYNADPLQHYRIAGVDDDGMWSVAELKTPFKKRADVRFWKPVDLYLALIDTKDGSTGGERTVAENVSRSGAAVLTTLKVGIGDRVKFISEEFDFAGLAVVCNAQPVADNRTRLHVEFVKATFPVQALMNSDVLVEEM
ncbi:MAG: hypothetical protein ABI857_07130 [Acidobacteriota bacterium]